MRDGGWVTYYGLHEVKQGETQNCCKIKQWTLWSKESLKLPLVPAISIAWTKATEDRLKKTDRLVIHPSMASRRQTRCDDCSVTYQQTVGLMERQRDRDRDRDRDIQLINGE